MGPRPVETAANSRPPIHGPQFTAQGPMLRSSSIPSCDTRELVQPSSAVVSPVNRTTATAGHQVSPAGPVEWQWRLSGKVLRHLRQTRRQAHREPTTRVRFTRRRGFRGLCAGFPRRRKSVTAEGQGVSADCAPWAKWSSRHSENSGRGIIFKTSKGELFILPLPEPPRTSTTHQLPLGTTESPPAPRPTATTPVVRCARSMQSSAGSPSTCPAVRIADCSAPSAQCTDRPFPTEGGRFNSAVPCAQSAQ